MKKGYAIAEVKRIVQHARENIIQAGEYVEDKDLRLSQLMFDDLETIFKIYLNIKGAQDRIDSDDLKLKEAEEANLALSNELERYKDMYMKLSEEMIGLKKDSLCIKPEYAHKLEAEIKHQKNLVQDLQAANDSLRPWIESKDKEVESLKGIIVKLAGKL